MKNIPLNAFLFRRICGYIAFFVGFILLFFVIFSIAKAQTVNEVKKYSKIITIDPVSKKEINDKTPRFITVQFGQVYYVDTTSGRWLQSESGVALSGIFFCRQYFPNTQAMEDYKLEDLGVSDSVSKAENVVKITGGPFKSVKCSQDPKIIVNNLEDYIKDNGVSHHK